MVFEEIAEAEEQHEARYRKLLANVREGKVSSATGGQAEVPHRGYVHEASRRQGVPACQHPQAYYELLADNY